MRRVAIVLLMIGWSVVVAACATEREEDRAPGASSEVSSEEQGELAPVQLAEKTQASCNSCECPRGQACNYAGVCAGYPVFGPIPRPPLFPPCVCDSQCWLGGPDAPPMPGAVCTNYGGSGYGYCAVPQCSASWSLAVVPPNGTVDFIVSSDWMPPGSYSRLYGTKDGITDENGAVYNLVSGVFPIQNNPGMAGTYMRYLRMYGPDHAQLCVTAPTYSTFQ